uniref:Uncharacterized protein n=1 Tax=Ananas comosus var. bracteatus TaxID=296719 RepID=A0A6V7PV69_ANACO|nr:unnamed protein product [Ananas comosus var. bracteatus]
MLSPWCPRPVRRNAELIRGFSLGIGEGVRGGCEYPQQVQSAKHAAVVVGKKQQRMMPLLKVSVREDSAADSVLNIRLYGPNTDFVIDRKRELKTRYNLKLIYWLICAFVSLEILGKLTAMAVPYNIKIIHVIPSLFAYANDRFCLNVKTNFGK